jgi:hypothetical protein
MKLKILKPDIKLSDQVKTHIAQTIDQSAKKWVLTGSWMLISVVLGFIISTIWDLNGKIYEVVGKQSIQYAVIDTLKNDIANLESKNSNLKNDNYNLKDKEFELRKELEKLRYENIKLSIKNKLTNGKNQ